MAVNLQLERLYERIELGRGQAVSWAELFA